MPNKYEKVKPISLYSNTLELFLFFCLYYLVWFGVGEGGYGTEIFFLFFSFFGGEGGGGVHNFEIELIVVCCFPTILTRVSDTTLEIATCTFCMYMSRRMRVQIGPLN